MAYDGDKFAAGTLEREVYDAIFPRFRNLIGPGLLKEIVEAVLSHDCVEIGELQEQLEESQGVEEATRRLLNDTLDDIDEQRKEFSEHLDALREIYDNFATTRGHVAKFLEERLEG